MAALNKTFATFVAAQLTRHPHGDFSAAANEYVQYVRKLRAAFARAKADAAPQPTGLPDVAAAASSPPSTPSSPLLQPEPEPPMASPVALPPATGFTFGMPSGTSTAVSTSTSAFGFGFSSGTSMGSFGSASAPARVPAPPALPPSAFSFGSPSGVAFGAAVPSTSPVQPASFAFGSGSMYPPAPTRPEAPTEFHGFLASAATYGAPSVWNDAELLRLKVDVDTVQCQDVVYNSADSTVSRGLWKGTTSVAVKQLAPARQTMANAIILATNITAIASLHHPRIVDVLGVAWVHAAQLQVCQVAIDVADALTFVHAQSTRLPLACLPSSRKVLLSVDGRAKLHVVHSTDHAAHRRALQVRYMAPEVIRGGAISSASDVYALGVLLCELDTTHVPYKDAVSPNGLSMEHELVAHHVVMGMLSPTPSPDCPPPLAKLIAQCTAYVPTARPTAAAVAYALRDLRKNDL